MSEKYPPASEPSKTVNSSDWISSHQFVHGPFAPHGEFRYRFRDGCFECEARGPMNLETVQALAEVRRQAVLRWPPDQGRIRVLVQWIDSAMMPPDAFKAFVASFQTAADSERFRVSAVAWFALPGVEGLELMAPHFEQVYREAGSAFAFFHDRAAAEAWLCAQA